VSHFSQHVRSLLFCGLLLSGLVASACSGGASAAAAPVSNAARGAAAGRGGGSGAVPVVTAVVSRKDVPVDIEAIGNVEAFATISIRSQVTGTVTRIAFHEGDSVKKGDIIFAIDSRPYQAQLDQARANLTRDQALLAQAEAQLNRDAAQAEYSQVTAERNAALTAKGIVAKDTSDQSRAAADAVAATVKADRAAIASAQAQLVAQQAAVDDANVLLGYCVIRAPLSGRTGNLEIKPGSLVTANSTELTTIAQIAPAYVTFAVPALHLPAIKQQMNAAPLSVIATPQEGEDGTATGRLTFIDNLVDASTDTIRLKAEFSNTDGTLWPGQFARVDLRLTTIAGATVVPSEAVQTGQDGQFVFAVEPDFTVEQRPVTVGQRVGEETVIAKGLAPGDTVVTEGQLRLEPGARIQRPGEGGAPGNAGGRAGRGSGGRGAGGGRG
jgi:membrane fusion protein, multidrug efflux system